LQTTPLSAIVIIITEIICYCFSNSSWQTVRYVCVLEYGCELWDDCCIRDTQTLECLQLETARIVTGLPIYSSAEIYILKLGGDTSECDSHNYYGDYMLLFLQ
jgi:hypothetical protein